MSNTLNLTDLVRRDRNASTIKRGLNELRDAGHIETHPDGYYVRTPSNSASGYASITKQWVSLDHHRR